MASRSKNEKMRDAIVKAGYDYDTMKITRGELLRDTPVYRREKTEKGRQFNVYYVFDEDEEFRLLRKEERMVDGKLKYPSLVDQRKQLDQAPPKKKAQKKKAPKKKASRKKKKKSSKCVGKELGACLREEGCIPTVESQNPWGMKDCRKTKKKLSAKRKQWEFNELSVMKKRRDLCSNAGQLNCERRPKECKPFYKKDGDFYRCTARRPYEPSQFRQKLRPKPRRLCKTLEKEECEQNDNCVAAHHRLGDRKDEFLQCRSKPRRS